MALPFCIELPELPDPLEVVLPGGISLNVKINIQDLNLLDAIQPALTPLIPFFNIIDVVIAVFNAIKAIPESLVPPDPSKIISAIVALAEKIAKLLKLIPQLSIPLTIVGILDMIISVLTQVKTLIVHLQEQLIAATAAADLGGDLGDPFLLALALCAQGNIAMAALNVGKNTASLGKLIAILNLFLGLIGGPQIPDLGSIAAGGLDEAIAPIDAILKVLKSIRSAIPIP